MNEHVIQNVVFGAIMLFAVIGSAVKQFRGSRRPSPLQRAAAVPAPDPAVRRRLAPPQTVKPIMPPVLRPAAAAYAFPELDLSLPGYDGVPVEAPRRRLRTLGGGPAIGSPAWAANAVVAAEILGPPVSLRSGATLGAPHAF